MDAQARKKALFRAKLNAQKKDKRINSPLVRYNEFDQPICRVCDVVLKSESYWDAHQASRKHHEAVNTIKASATGNTRASDLKPAPGTESSRTENGSETRNEEPDSATKLAQARSSSVLPSNFFDNQESKRPKSVTESKSVDPDLNKNSTGSATRPTMKSVHLENERDELPSGNAIHGKKVQPAKELPEKSMQNAGKEAKQIKGALPEGFFDNKEADLLARGIKPVKPDVKDEYKEFEKLIQEDLQEVDDRLEEEEIDAAEMIEEHESLEQKAYREKVETLKKKKMELEATRLAKHKSSSEVAHKESQNEDSSSDDDSEENFAVDWRAQHL